jgi:hypothetical protein
MPTYNRAHLLPRAIDSALAQTAAGKLDIVVVDDGSRDETRAVVARYGDRVQYVYQANGGLAAARNTGIRACPNEFVAFLDDDDEWTPEKTAWQLAVLERWPEVVLVAGRAYARYADGRERLHRLPPLPFERPVDFAPLLFEDNYLSVPMVLVRSAALLECGLHAPELRRRQDYHMWVRLACVGPFVFLDRRVCTYDAGTPAGLSEDRVAAMLANLRARQLLRPALRTRPDCRASWRRGMGLCYATLRDQAWQAGRFAAAARYGVQALRYHPSGRARWEWRRTGAALWRAIPLGCVWGRGERAEATGAGCQAQRADATGGGAPASRHGGV